MDISSLASKVTTAAGLGGLILATPKIVGYQPQDYPSFVKSTANSQPTFVFNYEGENGITLTSDITDHVIENNEVVNDQIALKPEIITVSAYVGNLNDIAPSALAPLKTVAQKLTAIGDFAPQLSVTALQAYNDAAFAYAVAASAANAAVSAWNSINGSGDVIANETTDFSSIKNQNNQQRAFQQLYGYFRNRQLFTIQTPWALFSDCAIQSIHATQDAETNQITSFELSFKVLRFAQTTELTSSVTSQNSQGRASSAAATEQNLGQNNLSTSPVPFAF